MTQDKDQLVDEQTMEKMSVAPPDPETAGDESGNGRTPDSDRHPDQQPESEAMMQDAAADGASGVADQDPLSAHPS